MLLEVSVLLQCCSVMAMMLQCCKIIVLHNYGVVVLHDCGVVVMKYNSAVARQ
jgi:hypothetical protein